MLVSDIGLQIIIIFISSMVENAQFLGHLIR